VINVAVIGVGKFGKYHAEKYSQMPMVALTLVDNHPKRAEALAVKLGATFTNDYRKLRGVEYVSIVTPDDQHYKIAKHFIREKTNVLIEKPMAMTIADADQLFVLAKLYEVQLLIGHLERYNSVYIAGKKNMSNGKGYEYIKAFRSNNGRDYPRDNSDVVLDLMLHDIDLTLDIVGEPIKYLQAKGLKNDLGKHYYANARMIFRNGTIADLSADRISKGKRASMHLIGGGAGIKLNFLEKENDTLADQLNHFLNGGYSNYEQSREALRIALEIIEKIR
jgi:predicted dehydrogenase